METPVGGDVERRLAALERQNRWLKVVAVLALIVGGVCLWWLGFKWAMGPSRVVEAGEFVLKGDDGVPMARLGVAIPGPYLSFYDQAQHTRLELGFYFDEPRVLLCDEAGRERVRIGFGLGGPRCAVYDEGGNRGAEIAVDYGDPYFCLFAKAGDPRVFLDLSKDKSGIHVFDSSGNVIWGTP